MQQMYQLHQDLVAVSEERDQEHSFRDQAQSSLEAMSKKLIKSWPKLWSVAPQLLDDITPITPVKCVEMIADAWSQLAEGIEDLQQNMDAIQTKEKEKPKSMQHNITQAVAEGNIIQSSLHDQKG